MRVFDYAVKILFAVKVHLWQLLDEHGRPVLSGAPKHEVAVKGLLHGAVHLWIWRRNGETIELLLQKRAASKVNWPNLLDKSAGGHIAVGEDPLDAVLRKTQQELGLTFDPKKIKLAGVHHWRSVFDEPDLVENEFQWVYLTEMGEVSPVLSKKEVQSTEWLQLGELRLLTRGDSTPNQFVPYGQAYFMMLCEAVERSAAVPAS